MKKVGKPVFFVVAAFIVAFATLAYTGIYTQFGDIRTARINGVQDVRLGIDIQGGVDVTFFPAGHYDADSYEMAAAAAVISQRLLVQNITDYELFPDLERNRIILRFPWQAGEVDFNPVAAIEELGATAMLTFQEGLNFDDFGAPLPTGIVILTGADVQSAHARFRPIGQLGQNEHFVELNLRESGRAAFADATGRLMGQQISIWMDDGFISAPQVNAHITDGSAVISGHFGLEDSTRLANQIMGGALPFSLETDNYNTISPTLGMGALQAMILAGLIAFIFICIFMLLWYRASGFVAIIGLVGQLAIMIAALTGFFAFIPAFTLTLPGIAGIILSVGMGVDANIITAERIKEELATGKTLDGAVAAGYKRAFAAIFDGNITLIIVAVILMGSFGPPTNFLAQLLSRTIFIAFGPTMAGSIYSFGYTLFVGVIANFIMGIFACRLMQRSLCRLTPMRKPWLFGGERA